MHVETRTLDDVMDVDDVRSVDGFLRESFAFRQRPSLLGHCTIMLEKLIYRRNGFDTPAIRAFSDLHDLLVDAPKQGFVYGHEDLDAFTKTLIMPKRLQPLAHKQTAAQHAETPKYNQDNVCDRLMFKVMKRHHDATRGRVQAACQGAKDNDVHLQRPYVDARQEAEAIPALHAALEKMVCDLQRLYSLWVSFADHGSPFAEMLRKCHDRYRDIRPSDKLSADCAPAAWQQPLATGCWSRWDMVRASAVYATFCATPRYPRGPFVFHMAGQELAFLKAHQGGPAAVRTLAWPMYTGLKPRRLRAGAALRRVNETDDEGDGADYDEAWNAL